MTEHADMARGVEHALALSYAPVDVRQAMAALFALDHRLGDVLRSSREPMLGQLRLAWWREALSSLDQQVPPAEPLLRQLVDTVLQSGISGAELAELVDGWDMLAAAEFLDVGILKGVSSERGGKLFLIGAKLLNTCDPQLPIAGEGWALADLGARLSNRVEAERATMLARERLALAFRQPWPRRARALGGLALLARFDVSEGGSLVGSPKRVGRLLLHRLTGR